MGGLLRDKTVVDGPDTFADLAVIIDACQRLAAESEERGELLAACEAWRTVVEALKLRTDILRQR